MTDAKYANMVALERRDVKKEERRQKGVGLRVDVRLFV